MSNNLAIDALQINKSGQAGDGTSRMQWGVFGSDGAFLTLFETIDGVPVQKLNHTTVSGGQTTDFADQYALRWVNPDGGVVVQAIFTAGAVIFPNLPTSDPHTPGQMWNNAGALNISAG